MPTAVLTPEFTGQEITELWELIPLGDSLQRIELVRDANELGDANGDGYGDVALTTYDTMDVAGEVICLGALHGGANVSASTVSDQLGGRVCYQRNYPDQINVNPGRQPSSLTPMETTWPTSSGHRSRPCLGIITPTA